MSKALPVRERILAVATDLFYHQGYQLTGINQIIAEADIARGSLYNHFPSKTDLLIAYINERSEGWFSGFTAFTAAMRSPRQQLLALFDYHMQLQQQHDYCGCHFVKIQAEADRKDTAVFELVAAHKARQQALIRELVSRLPADTAMPHAQLADTVFLLLEGAVANATVNRNIAPLKKAKSIVQSFL